MAPARKIPELRISVVLLEFCAQGQAENIYHQGHPEAYHNSCYSVLHFRDILDALKTLITDRSQHTNARTFHLPRFMPSKLDGVTYSIKKNNWINPASANRGVSFTPRASWEGNGLEAGREEGLSAAIPMGWMAIPDVVCIPSGSIVQKRGVSEPLLGWCHGALSS